MCIKYLAECLAYDRHLNVTSHPFIPFLFPSHPTSIPFQHFWVHKFGICDICCMDRHMCWQICAGMECLCSANTCMALGASPSPGIWTGIEYGNAIVKKQWDFIGILQGRSSEVIIQGEIALIKLNASKSITLCSD